MAAAAQRLLLASTKIVGVGRNYVAHAKELGNPVPKVRAPPPTDLTPRLRSRGTILLIPVVCL
jgi:2-keto-4-pentenoate hydratase/2-oxohepta-3-ene-1,7-dioic acid hydratase in catechol pathway